MDKKLSIDILKDLKIRSYYNQLGLKPGDIVKHLARDEYGIFVGIKPKRPGRKEVVYYTEADDIMFIALVVSRGEDGQPEIRTRYIKPGEIALVEKDGVVDLVKEHCENDCILDCGKDCLLWKLKQNLCKKV